MVLSLRDRMKASKQKFFKEKKLKDKRIHDNLILLRQSFPIIVLESLRRIARWTGLALSLLPTLHHHTHYSRDAPHHGVSRYARQIVADHLRSSRASGHSPEHSHAFHGIRLHSILDYVQCLHATCSPTAGGETSR